MAVGRLVLAASGVAVFAGILVWRVNQPPRAQTETIRDVAVARSTPRRAVRSEPAKARPQSQHAKARVDASAPTPSRLTPSSATFAERIDVLAANRFRSAAAPCFGRDAEPNAEMILRYTLSVHNGQVSAAHARVHKTELDDAKLKGCVVSAVQRESWQDDELPDWSEEQELFIRVRSLAKYRRRRARAP